MRRAGLFPIPRVAYFRSWKMAPNIEGTPQPYTANPRNRLRRILDSLRIVPHDRPRRHVAANSLNARALQVHSDLRVLPNHILPIHEIGYAEFSIPFGSCRMIGRDGTWQPTVLMPARSRLTRTSPSPP